MEAQEERHRWVPLPPSDCRPARPPRALWSACPRRCHPARFRVAGAGGSAPGVGRRAHTLAGGRRPGEAWERRAEAEEGAGARAQPGLLTRSPRPGRRRARGWSRAPPGSRAGGGRGRLSGGRLGRPCEVRDVQRENNTNLEINQVTPATSVRLFLPLPSGCRPPLTRCWVTRRLLLAAPASPPLLVRTGSE